MIPKIETTPEEDYLAVTDCQPSHVFTWRRSRDDGKGGLRVDERKIRVALPSKMAELQAIADSQKMAAKYGEASGYSDVYREAQAIHILAQSLVAMKPREREDGTAYYPQLYTDAGHIARSLNSDEMALLLNCLEAVRAKYAALESFTEADIELWAARLADPLRRFDVLGQLSSWGWPALCLGLAELAMSLCQEFGCPERLTSLLTSGSEQAKSLSDTTSSSGQPNVWSSEPDEPDPLLEARSDGVKIPEDMEAAKKLAREVLRNK